MSTGAMAQTSICTNEVCKSGTLESVKASNAWSRGYTGKGSTIGILDTGLDTGIDTKNAEFAGRIKLFKDFTYAGTDRRIIGVDTIGHGTHVAGIAAAAGNGQGVVGVAYEANLLIGRISSNGTATIDNLVNGVKWANDLSADVVNLSFGSALPRGSIGEKLIDPKIPGVYKTIYTNTGNLPYNLSTQEWVTAMKGNMVLVLAAGNSGTPWSGALTQLATATDKNNNLLLGGRVIVAGNWDPVNKVVANSSDRAAHLCQNTVKGVMNTEYCADKYRMSQFYLLAPGTNIISTVPTTVSKTGLVAMTGTSMAAPAISGGVALIRQMWPQMTGANITQLLFKTANKNLSGYKPEIHGQGLMDLDMATRPVGATGIPTTGRLSGPTITAIQPVLITGGSAGTAKINGVMVVDSFERDFYIPGKVLTAYNNQSYFNIAQAAMPYETRNNYSQFNNYTDYVHNETGDFEVNLYRNTNFNLVGNNPGMFEMGYRMRNEYADVKFTSGMFVENDTWLGNALNSFGGGGNNRMSSTYFTGIGIDKTVGKNNFYANVTHGVTLAGSSSDNVNNLDSVLSYTWTVGAEHHLNNKSALGLMVYQPVSVYRAMADVTAPVGLDSDFNVIQNSRQNLAATVHETRVGLYYKFKDEDSSNLLAFVENRQNYRGQTGVSDNVAGISFNQRF
jgi:subtilisin family serine protease